MSHRDVCEREARELVSTLTQTARASNLFRLFCSAVALTVRTYAADLLADLIW